MTAHHGKAVIAIATSIPPKQEREDDGRVLADYQSRCIKSWIENGFRILSVNDPGEIPDLAARHPEVTFIPASRNASKWTGRKNPFIADLLLALKDAPEPVLGLINSDLLFEPSSAWMEHLPSQVPHAMVLAHRQNTTSLRHGALRRFQGIDCFFFDKSFAVLALENALPFAIGAPWWDYWFPCIALLNNRKITVVDRPAVLHLVHKTAYSKEMQDVFGHALANAVLRESENTRYPHPPVFAALKEILIEVSDTPLEPEVLRRKFVEFSEIFEAEIRKSAVSWISVTNDPHPAGWKSAFDRIDQRLSAGAAYKKIKMLMAQKLPLDIGPELVEALSQAPQDPDSLLILAEIFRLRGEFQTAEDLCIKAADLLPGLAVPLHGRGVVLETQGRHEEALSCFRRALEIEPTHQPSCIRAAGTLWDMNRREEALRLLDDILARHPGLDRVADFRGRLANPQ
jgi:hypothetical protein